MPRPLSTFRPRSGQGAFALILVLITVTLATVVVVFYLSTIARERSAIDLYAQQSRARQLSSTAVNLVIGQISAATKEGTLATPASWASQPGMIRTYNTSGNLSKDYKLYSWDTLVEPGAGFDPNVASELPPTTWESSPSLFTDLNQPVNGVYPIADPTAANIYNSGGDPTVLPSAGTTNWDFPGEYSIDRYVGYTQAYGPGASGVADSRSVPNLLPMPVKWLYVLQDGTWVAPTNTSGKTPTFPATLAPSKTNPIVGRIAFWTDDETSKVNVNTAGEGAYWDWPKAATKDEMQFAANPPLKNEFQRVAGHPFTTSLSAVFPELRPDAAYTRWAGLSGPNTAYVNALLGNAGSKLAGIFDIMPRVGGGVLSGGFQGSMAGTFPVSYDQGYPLSSAMTFNNGSAFMAPEQYGPVAVTANRLYATSDDFWYKSGVPASGSTTFTGRTGNDPLVAAYVNPQLFRQRLFFLTANSRAPETTLFETPRVSLWPITWPYPASYYYNQDTYYKQGASPTTNTVNASDRGVVPSSISVPSPNPPTSSSNTLATLIAYTGPNGQPNITPQEQLIAFDSTLNQASGALPYYFQRQSADSPTNDWVSITRNRQIANYLRGELKGGGAVVGIPGFGPTLETKWDTTANTTDWITLNIMDYSRSMINQYTFNPNPDATTKVAAGELLYSFTGIGSHYAVTRQSGSQYSTVKDIPERNAFSVIPLRIRPTGGDTPNFTSGFPLVTEGSFPTLKEVSVMFYATSRLEPKFIGPKEGPTNNTKYDVLKTDPFQWINLICPLNSTPPVTNNPTPGATMAKKGIPWPTLGSDGKPNLGAPDEENFLYPNGSKTTAMQAVMFFSFTGILTLTPDSPSGPLFNPNFWIKVEGDSFEVNGLPIKLPNGPTSVEWNTRGPVSGPPTFEALFIPERGLSNAQTNNVALASPKTFTNGVTSFAGNVNGSLVWALCSSPITVDPLWVTFPFRGTPLTVKIYAPYAYDPSGTGKNPDMDPTGDESRLISSYPVDFSSWTCPSPSDSSPGLAVPIAPRWNGRQGASTISVPRPIYTNKMAKGATVFPSSPYPPYIVSAQTSLWMKSEFVPNRIQELGSFGATKLPTGTFDRDFGAPSNHPFITKATDFTSTTTTLDGTALSAAGNFMAYAYKAYPSKGTAAQIASQPNPLYTPFDDPNPDPADSTDTQMFSTRIENRLLSMAYDYSAEKSGSQLFNSGFGSTGHPVNNWACPSMITPYDTVISVEVDPRAAQGGDPRLTMMGTGTGANLDLPNAAQNAVVDARTVFKKTVCETPSTVFNPAYYPRYTQGQQYHELGSPSAYSMDTGYQFQPTFVNGMAGVTDSASLALGATTTPLAVTGGVSMGGTEVWGSGVGVETTPWARLNSVWDWTSQSGNNPDGGYIQRPDQEYAALSQDSTNNSILLPYFSKAGLTSVTQTNGAVRATSANFFSPNRQVPSPIILGTIPSSTIIGWQTLAFCPNPAAATKHPGIATPAVPSAQFQPYTGPSPDHLLLDLLWMPVAEPYPISEQFSTAGKINLNYAMMPFPYLKRKTGLDALLKAVWIYALPNTATGTSIAMSYDYKAAPLLTGDTTRTRYPIDVSNTLMAFDYKFNKGDIFRSASQICDMFLYPANPDNPKVSLSTLPSFDTPPDTSHISSWWTSGQVLTSDNGREEPYNAIYSRVTTKSNTYTVHWRVQALQKSSATVANTWDEAHDRVASDVRGSTLIERYLDPNANQIPDYATISITPAATAPTLSQFYKWRVATENYFQP